MELIKRKDGLIIGHICICGTRVIWEPYMFSAQLFFTASEVSCPECGHTAWVIPPLREADENYE